MISTPRKKGYKYLNIYPPSGVISQLPSLNLAVEYKQEYSLLKLRIISVFDEWLVSGYQFMDILDLGI
jgi:hypothetical protein